MFILVVEGNSIRSQAVEGGNFHIRQDDALSGMEVGDLRSQTPNARKTNLGARGFDELSTRHE